MTSIYAEIDWTGFLGRPSVQIDPELAKVAAGERCVLITGAGGSIGSGLARAVLSGRPRSVILLDYSEHALYQSYRKYPDTEFEVVPIIGSVSDVTLLNYLFRHYRPDLVLHAAAYKHVPLMEQNPFSAIVNNAIGTYALVTAVVEHSASQLVMVSTDKAVNPQSIMGVSKRIAEQVVLSYANEQLRMSVVRLGNVLGSSGSVVPILQEQAQMCVPMTVTHPEVQRYFVTPAEAEVAILRAAASSVWGRVLVPDCGEPFKIVDLARYIAGDSKAKIEFIGLRPGDKLKEELWSSEERVETVLDGGLRVVVSPIPSNREMRAAIQRIEAACRSFDYSELMLAITDLVPSYKSANRIDPAKATMEAG